jgi:hypothetical protein
MSRVWKGTEMRVTVYQCSGGYGCGALFLGAERDGLTEENIRPSKPYECAHCGQDSYVLDIGHTDIEVD